MLDSVSSLFAEFRAMRPDTPSEVQDALDVRQRSRTSVLPWRGQFSPQLIEYLLKRHAAPRVLDPFCGSGTVLYEAAALRRSAFGLDVNPAAVTLAKFATYARHPAKERVALLAEFERKIKRALSSYSNPDQIDLSLVKSLPRQTFYDCFLLLLFGDRPVAAADRALGVLQQLSAKLLALPAASTEIDASIGDARHMELQDGSFDFAVTSPPYINVFNYHQNYRPVMEALGAVPLASAVAEIGANRKHRQNRFLTVIQYCIDMQAVLAELWRVLVPRSEAVFVVGRSSRVRGVPFLNAELIAAVAILSETFVVRQREERVFTNRFGERIF